MVEVPYVMSAAERTSSAELWMKGSLGLQERETLRHCPQPVPHTSVLEQKDQYTAETPAGLLPVSRLPVLLALCE